MTTLAFRLGASIGDGNLDLEDILFALQAARADGVLTSAELAELQAALAPHTELLEPAARALVADLAAGTARLLPRRVLLAPVPSSAPDLYQPRAEVVALQDALTALGHAATADGLYGSGTAARVCEVQAAAGLPQSGQVDSATLLALNERLSTKGLPPLDLAPRARIRPDQVVALRGGTPGETTRGIQAALARLATQIGAPALDAVPDGVFGPGTEAAVKAFQQRLYLPETGIVDRTTLGALDDALAHLALAPTGVTPPSTGAGFDGNVELHFYPGDAERKVYVEREGRELARYGMVGGENQFRDDPHNPTVDYSPSPEGAYTVVRVSPHASYSWPYSYVPYGAQLRDTDGEVQFRDVDGTWRFATGPNSVFARRNPPPLGRASYRDASGVTYTQWRLNDFGHLRGQLKSVRTGQLQGHMIHGSPHQQSPRPYFADTRALLDPATALDVLDYSHGCEHIHPRDLDDMVARGYLAPGTRFVVHGYDVVRGGGPTAPAVA